MGASSPVPKILNNLTVNLPTLPVVKDAVRAVENVLPVQAPQISTMIPNKPRA